MAREFLAGLIARARLGIPIGAPATPAVADLYAVGDTVRYRDSVSGERTLLNSVDNLANLSDIAAARNNIGVAAAFAGYAVGNWIQPVIGTLSNITSSVASTIYLYPFVVNRSITVSDLGARVTGPAASAQFQLAIYASSSGLPTGTPLGITGNLEGSAATHVSGLVTPFNLTAGQLYWAGFNCSIAITMQQLSGSSTYFGSVVGSPSLADVTSNPQSSAFIRTINQTYGTWPNLTSATTTVQQGSTGMRGACCFLKVSALL